MEIPHPREADRRALIGLYARDLPFSAAAVARAARGSAGSTASYAKELVRRAVLLVVMDGREPTDDDLEAANTELQSDAARLTRALLGAADDRPSGSR